MAYSDNSEVFDMVRNISEVNLHRGNTGGKMNPKIRYVSAEKFNQIAKNTDGPDSSVTKQPAVPKTVDSQTSGPQQASGIQQASGKSPAKAMPNPYTAQRTEKAISPAEDAELKLELTNQNLLNGFIMSEVLGRPKCFRTMRRSNGR